jgi:putative transposase
MMGFAAAQPILPTAPFRYDPIPAPFPAWRIVFLHRQPGESAAAAVDRPYRSAARGVPLYAGPPPFTLDAIVVLPEHLHAIWTLPHGDADFPTRWRLIKSHFSRALPPHERRSASRLAKGERGIWQRRYWEHALRDETDFERHANYIHFNPVKHGHVDQVIDWAFSSFHREVRLGIYAPDWAGDADQADAGQFGETA